MTVKQLDTLLAIKELSYAPGLSANARAVGALLVDRYNRKTGQCDPGLEGIASHLQISSRTVMRSVLRLEAAGLIRRLRHGGHGNRNQYEPNWVRFRELEADWSSRLRGPRSRVDREVSPPTRHSCHLEGDKTVAQTFRRNLQANKPYSGNRPNEKKGRKDFSHSTAIVITPRSSDAADAEAERRWAATLHDRFASVPVTYGEIVAAITPEIQSAATSAERQHRGAGFAFILRRLKLGPAPVTTEGQ
jgi:DNA-binding transcriptional ArsR family regulator